MLQLSGGEEGDAPKAEKAAAAVGILVKDQQVFPTAELFWPTVGLERDNTLKVFCRLCSKGLKAKKAAVTAVLVKGQQV